MKRNNYFVNLEEFIEKGKSPLVAALLSFFFGMIGAQRFYLERRKSGIRIIILFALVANFDVFVVPYGIYIISTWLEAINYLTLIPKYWRYKRELKEEKGRHSLERNNLNVSMPLYKKEEKDMEIIDLSNEEEETLIFHEDDIKTDWIELLEIPYERNVMEVNQIKEETLNMYEQLCKDIDKELWKYNTSLVREYKNLMITPGYYNNILYTIYCISEGHVTKAYTGNFRTYNPNFSYEILENHLGYDIRKFTEKRAVELELNVNKPDLETIEYFGLNKYGLPMVWWDRDGSIRTKFKLKDSDKNILSATKSRNTKIWKDNNGKLEILKLYLSIWEELSKNFNNEDWDEEIRLNFRDVYKGNINYYNIQSAIDLSNSLLRVSEEAVRNVFDFQSINIDKDKDNIQFLLPENISKKVFELLKLYIKENVRDKKENKEAYPIEAKRKVVKLDPKKIADSKEELSEVVDVIQNYIGDNEEISRDQIVKPVIEERTAGEEKVNEFKNIDFIKKIIKSGKIHIDDGEKIARKKGLLLNAFISQINDELYDYIQDQTILIEDDYIKIDDFYVDIVKELI